MPSWLLKAATQRLIGALPGRHRWNELFQTHVTHSLELSEADFEAKVADCRRALEALHRHGATDRPFTALELGSGWYPVLSVGLALCRAETVWTWDIAPLLTRSRVRLVFERYVAAAADGRLAQLLPGVRPERLARLQAALADPGPSSPAELLRRIGVRAVVGDVRRSGLADGSVDLFASVVVLEYIEPVVLAGVFAEFRRLASPGSVMSHVIDLADQYAAFDRSLSRLNFLRYGDLTWRLLNNPLIPLNRLRISDYRRLLATAGFRIVDEALQLGRADELAGVPLAPRFRTYPIDDLTVLRARLAAVPSECTD